MKRALMLVLLAGLFSSIIFTGCTKKDAAQQTGSSAAVQQAGSSEVTIRLLTDATGIDDKSFNAAAWQGILQFYGDTWQNTRNRGRLYDVVTAQTPDMYIPNLRQAVDEGYDLICTTGFTFADALTTVALQNPNQKFLSIDTDWIHFSGVTNVLEVVFAEHEGSYLVGVATALKAKADNIANPRFGFIGGVPGATITKFEVGYVQGILSVFPNAQIVDYYTNDWGAPALAKTQATNWYNNGIYAIYSAAGGSGNGTIAQAKELRAAGQNVWAIGVDSDQHDEGIYSGNQSAVLTSMLKRVETGLIYGLNAVKNNTFRGEVIALDLRAEGVGYATTNTSAMTADIVNELERIKQQIINGQITVAATYAAAKALPGFPQNLLAIDD